MKPRVAQSYRDALVSIDQILGLLSFVKYDRRRFERHAYLPLAMERLFGRLGAALERVVDGDPWAKTDIPEVDEMIGMHTFLRKRYDESDTGVLWTTALEDMGDLRRVIRAALTQAGEPLI